MLNALQISLKLVQFTLLLYYSNARMLLLPESVIAPRSKEAARAIPARRTALRALRTPSFRQCSVAGCVLV